MAKIVNLSEFSNDSLEKSASANENGISAIFNYNGNNVTFKAKNGIVYVNATEMAKPFGKRPVDYLRLPSTNELMKVMVNRIESFDCLHDNPDVRFSHIVENKLVITVKGGIPGKSEQGTWLHEDIAIDFAQWLSVDFRLWCNDKIKELLTTGRAEIRTCVQPQTRGQELVLSTLTGVDFMSNALRMNDASKAALFNKASEALAEKDIAYIPAIDYVDSRGRLLSATELLQRNKIYISVNKFNKLMMIEGFLEEMSRSSSKGGVKHFKSLTDKGLEFGENQVSPHNPRETQPLYYEGKFRQLLSILKIID